MAGERKLTVVLAGDSRSLDRTLGSVSGKLDGFGSKFANFGKKAAIGLGGGIVAAGALAKSAVDAGSDLNETLSKSNTVFGQQGKAVETWADGAAKSFGQSKQQALEAASSFGNMFSQLGIGEVQAKNMSTSMTELASDFASFHNADISEVLTAQQAAFRGEYDALQRFVPTISAAAVEQKALAQTGKKTTKELTAQEKAIAVQTLMMEGAGDAMGDFARTSDGLANKQRIMSARFEDVKAKIGQALIPIVLRLSDVFLNKVIPAFESVVRWTRENWPQIQATIQNAVQGIRNFVEPIINGLRTLWENFGNNILEFVQRVWPAIQQVIEGVLNTIRGIIQVVTSLIRGDWSGVWEGIKNVFSGVWNGIQGILKTALETIRLALGAALEVIGSVFKAGWNGIIDWFRGLPEKIGGIASDMWEALKSGLAAAAQWIINKLDTILGPLDEVLGGLSKVRGFVAGGDAFSDADLDKALKGRRAAGGPVSPGNWLVGENGPEILSIGSSGYVTPNHKLGGGAQMRPVLLTLQVEREVLGRVLIAFDADYRSANGRPAFSNA